MATPPVAGQPLPAAAGRRRRSTSLAVAAGVAGVVILALVIAFAMGAFSGDGGNAPERASAAQAGDTAVPVEPDVPGQTEGPTETAQSEPATPRQFALVAPARPIGGGHCFATRATRTTYLVLGGIRYEQNNLQCGDRSGAGQASGGFVVVLPASFDGGTITDFTSTVGIDESSDSPAASAEWEVSYDGTVLCDASIADGSPTTCEAHRLSVPVTPGGVLRLTQSVRPADPSLSLWAGFHLPSVTVAGGRDARSATAPTEPAAEDSDPAAALDRIFLELKAGDYGSGSQAETLYSRLMESGHPLRGNAAFNAGVIRYANGDCVGAYAAFVDATAVPGTQAQEALRRAALKAAEEGCATPVASLVGP